MERFLDEQKQKSNHFQQFEFQTSQVEFGKSSGYDWHKSCQYFRWHEATKAPRTRKTTTTYKQPSKQVKTKTPEPSYYMSHWISQMKHLHWSFSALPSVSHFTLRLTKRLARILITAHLGVRLGQFRLKGWGGWEVYRVWVTNLKR